MRPTEIARCFEHGQVTGPSGVIEARGSLLTRKSLVVFTERSVIKIRRPIAHPEMDMTSATRRRFVGEQERWIGARISPGAYLGSATLQPNRDGQLALVPGRVPGEGVVAMLRFDAETSALKRLAQPDATFETLRCAVERIANYHSDAPFHRQASGWGAPGRMAARMVTALAELDPTADEAPLTPDEHAGLVQDSAARFAALEDLLAHRVIEGRMRHGHGDLRLEHIFLGDRDGIIDPDERDDQRHWSDTAEDVALMALELDILGRPALSEQAMAHYAALTSDRSLPRVLPIFKRLHAVRHAVTAMYEARSPGADLETLRIRARRMVEVAISL